MRKSNNFQILCRTILKRLSNQPVKYLYNKLQILNKNKNKNKILMISKQDIEQAHQRIKPFIHRTPIISCDTLAEMIGCERFALKCENFQKIGAFKPRGGFNKLLQLPQGVKTVCTHSSGNHAQAIAYGAKVLGLQAKIVMPQNSPTIKKLAVRGYGAEVIESGNKIIDRENKCKQIQLKYNAVFCHPYNDKQVIAGQATCAKQIFQDSLHDKYDYVIVPIGGGGLASGTLLSAEYFGDGCKIICVQPQLARDAYDSLQKQQIQPQYPPISIADGLRTSLGPLTFSIIKQHVNLEDLLLVSQQQIIQATKLVFQRMKLVIQPSSATVVAAVIKNKERFVNKKVCCIISGGNVELDALWDSLRSKLKA